VSSGLDLAAAQVLFDGEQLTLAREYLGLRKVELARLVDVTPAAITQYEQGRTRPSRSTLAALSLQLGLPPAFFESGQAATEVSEATTHFRSLRSTTRTDRLQLLARLRLLARLCAIVDEHVELPAVDVPRLDVDRSASAVATAARAARSGASATVPITHVVRALEAYGVIVTRPRLATSAVDAFSCWLDDWPVIVLASDKGDGARSRFDAAPGAGGPRPRAPGPRVRG